MKTLLHMVAACLLALPSLVPSSAQPARLVRDFSTGTASVPVETPWLHVAGNQFFFGLEQYEQGEVLWRSDGTDEGTYPVHHFADGLGFGRTGPEFAAVSGDRLLLWAPLGDGEPWISDGTAAGTHELELCPGPCRPRTSAPVELAGRLLFAGWSPDEGYEVRVTDGSVGIAETLLPLLPGPEDGVSGSTEPAFQPLGGKAVFLGRTDPERQGATELWITDGTSGGTRRLADPGAGTASLVPGELQGRAFFRFQPVGGDDSLWVTDGTSGGTRRLASLTPGPGAPPAASALTANDLAFWVYRLDAATDLAWPELWKTNGTAGGTVRVVEIRYLPSVASFSPFSPPSQKFLYRFGNRVFFSFLGGGFYSWLWTSDGTAAGTRIAFSAEGPAIEYPSSFTEVGGRLLLLSVTENRNSILYSVFAGDQPRLLLETDYQHYLVDLEAFGDGAVFLQKGGGEVEIWRTDGSPEGTRRLRRLASGPASSETRQLLRHGEGLFLVNDAQRNGSLLWRTDGSDQGSVAIDLDPDAFGPDPYQLASDGQDLLALTGDGLYRVDSEAQSSEKLFSAASFVPSFSLRGRQVFFSNEDEAGREPWVGNLDSGQARRLRDINAGFEILRNGARQPRSSDAWRFTSFAQQVYFLAYNEQLGTRLWRSNGTAGGTVPVEALPGQSPIFSNPVTLVPGEEQMFLVSSQGVWATGSPPDSLHEVFRTRQDFDILEGAAFKGRLFFAETPVAYFNAPVTATATLWSSDGSAAGVTEILRGELPWAAPQNLTAAGLTLYFSAMTAEHGWELWATDGTAEGTRLVKDIAPGPASSNPRDLRAVAGRLLFSADDGLHGHEPWVSDGTADGTFLVADVDEGALSSFPREFTSLGGEVMFSAERADVGRELFAVERPEAGHRCQPSERRLCLQGGRIGVEVEWHNPRSGETGVGHAEAYSDETGTFWFFEQATVELLVKALDGRLRNDSFWFFSGGLSDIVYWVTATDFETGRTRTYRNPEGNLCGQADLVSLADRELVPTQIHSLARRPEFSRGELTAVVAPGETCPAPAGALLLQDGRFAVEVEWQTQRAGGRQGLGTAVSATDKSGYFWFFGPRNLELALKVLDGRRINGHFWVLWGALTDVAYQIRVTDLETCQQRTYTNPEGNLCGGADNRAF